MPTTIDEFKSYIDSMVLDSIPSPTIEEWIKEHANGNADELVEWTHFRVDSMPDDFLTDAGNGEAFAAAWRDIARYVYEWKSWIIFVNGKWMIDTTSMIRKLAVKTVRRLYMDTVNESDPDIRKKKAKWYTDSENDKRITAMINHAVSQPGISITADQLDDKPWLLNLKNGTLDLETGQLHAFNAADLLTQQIDIDYNPEAEAEEWDNFLDTIFNHNNQLIEFIQRSIGYTLNGTQLERVFYFLYGTGKNGKSQFMDALRRVLGDYAMEAKPEVFMEKKYSDSGPNEGQAALRGARLLSSTEIKRGQNLDVSLIKRMTGGELIWHERKFQRGFNFRPTHTLWLSGNHEPRIKDNTESIWDRVMKIPFAVRINAESEIKGYGEKLADKYSEAILNWCIQGAFHWKEQGLSSPPECVVSANSEYRASQDALHDFLELSVQKMVGESVFVSDMYKAYTEFCQGDEIEPISKRAFNEAMRERGFKDKRGTDNKLLWVGITLSTRITDIPESSLNTRAREETFPKKGNFCNVSNFQSQLLPNCPECGSDEIEFIDPEMTICTCKNGHTFSPGGATL